MKLITAMSSGEARNFLLKHQSYCNFSLPPYFDFFPLLQSISSDLSKKTNGLNDMGLKSAAKHDNVNYILQTNKDGHYAWRQFQLIHPALYVHLVNKITEKNNWNLIKDRFTSFSNNKNIFAASLPGESEIRYISDTSETVSEWWSNVEQLSISKALEFKYLFITDISNYYPSIYTHSISWAIHTKEVAKKPINRNNNNMIGVTIDKTIQHMQNGQTNGIPQGSVLMDFVAEMILGYADSELTQKLNNEGLEDYYIIRYRDDYRVFTNSKEDSEFIARQITTTLQELGLQLNPSKTTSSEDIILSSIKQDKLDSLSIFSKNNKNETFQKTLLKLIIFSRDHPNSGQISKQLAIVNKALESKKELVENPLPLISIITDIMLNNPRTFDSCALVLSNMLKFIESDIEKLILLNRIRDKFKSILGTGILDVWLQRISYSIQSNIKYDEPLCNLVEDYPSKQIWNSDWITNRTFANKTMTTPFINQEILNECDSVINEKEVVLFTYNTY